MAPFLTGPNTCQDAEMDDYLRKPIQTRPLYETLARSSDQHVKEVSN